MARSSELKGADLPLQLQQWQDYYNHQHRYGCLNQALGHALATKHKPTTGAQRDDSQRACFVIDNFARSTDAEPLHLFSVLLLTPWPYAGALLF